MWLKQSYHFSLPASPPLWHITHTPHFYVCQTGHKWSFAVYKYGHHDMLPWSQHTPIILLAAVEVITPKHSMLVIRTWAKLKKDTHQIYFSPISHWCLFKCLFHYYVCFSFSVICCHNWQLSCRSMSHISILLSRLERSV